MIWHRSLDLHALPLGFLRAANARGAEIYARPARGRSWPLVFLDDVESRRARAVARKYRALVIETSTDGGAHVWLACTRALEEHERAQAQRWLARLMDADPASTSGEHLGRLAGFKNWKRGGVWVNVLARSNRTPPWDPAPALDTRASRVSRPIQGVAHGITTPVRVGRDSSPSGRDWAWACSLLEHSADAQLVVRQLIERARDRRGRAAESYARRTVASALRHIRGKER